MRIYIKNYPSKHFPFAAHWYVEKHHYFAVYENENALRCAMIGRFGKCVFYNFI